MVNEGLCICEDCKQIQDTERRFACKNCRSPKLRSNIKDVLLGADE